jgi:CheY-like chemotaxis protein
MLDVSIATNGLEAVEKYQQAIEEGKQYLVVFMDVNMPVMDGLTATKGILAIDSNASVVMTTGNVLAEDLALYTAAGAVNVMMKPFSKLSTLTLVSKCVNQHMKCTTLTPSGRVVGAVKMV